MSNKPHLSVSKFMMGEKEYRLSGFTMTSVNLVHEVFLDKLVFDTRDAAKILFGTDDDKARRKVRRLVTNGILESHRRPTEYEGPCRSNIYISKRSLERFLKYER